MAGLFAAEGAFRNPGTLDTSIRLFVGGDLVPVLSAPRFTLQRDTHHRCRLLREPRRLTIWLDDEEVATAPVDEMTAPFLQLGAGSDTGGQTISFDNVEVRAPSAAGPSGPP